MPRLLPALLACLCVFVTVLAGPTTRGAFAGDPDAATQWNERGVELSRSGRYEEALAAFDKALAEAPGDDQIGRNRALARGNWGVALLRDGKAAAAEKQTRRALEAVPDDPILLLNLAACLDEQGYPAKAAQAVRQAAEHGPSLASVQRKLGSVCYREGKLAESVAAWERALELEPSNTAGSDRLERARASLALETRLSHEFSSHFTIYFEMEKHAVLAALILRELEDVQNVVRADLQAVSAERLKTVLLSTEEFRALTGAHRWVAGLFDGQIRLPVKDVGQKTDELLRKARHEYVHAVLAPLGNRAPAWLHEGLAQVYEGRSVGAARKRLLATRLKPLPFEELANSFANTADAGRAGQQYDTALVFTDWLREGEHRSAFRAAMERLFEGAPLDDAVRKSYQGADLSGLYGRFRSTLDG